MRILAISHLFPHVKEKRYGIFAARQMHEIHKLGAHVTVVVPRVWCPGWLRHFDRWKEKDHRCPLCEYDGLETLSVSYIRPPGNWYNRWSGLVSFLAMRKRIRWLHERNGFDVIYATDFFPDGDAAVRLGKELKLPAACLGIGVDVNVTAHTSRAMYRHFGRIANALDGTLACGQSVADGIKAVTGKSPLCVYGVLDLEEFSPVRDKAPSRSDLGLPLGKIVALYAGYLMKRKGICELVEALYRIQAVRSDVLLVMCGDGPDAAWLRGLIADRRIGNVVRMVGEVAPEEMSKWMRASDLFVLPTHTEGMPNVVMEAMACGLPVVATAVGGLPAAVGDCEGAVLIPPKDVDALVAAILMVAGDEPLRNRMGAAGRQRAEERFGVTRNARVIFDYLQQIVQNSHAGRYRGTAG